MLLRLLLVPHLILGLPGVLVAQRTATGTEKSAATVEVFAVDALGGPLPNARVVKFRGKNRVDYARRFRDGLAAGIPFGEYELEVSERGFITRVRLVRVEQPHETVVMMLEVSWLAGPIKPPDPSYKLTGSVVGAPLPDGKRAFVKVLGVLSGYARESGINPDGQFELAGLPSGVYLLLVIAPDSILGSRVVSLPKDIEGVASPLIQIEIKDNPALRWR